MRACSRAAALALIACIAAPPSPIVAQVFAPAWDGPYVLFANDPGRDRHYSEIAHAALIGKPGEHQGKVILWRAKTNLSPNNTTPGIWLWSPAAPSSVDNADVAQVPHNIFCCVQVWDADGDLIVIGGDFDSRDQPCSTAEPNWCFTMDPTKLRTASQAWQQPPDLMVPAPPGRRGHYYAAGVAMHDGSVVQIGATSAPWDRARCNMDNPDGNAVKNSNWWQRFDKTYLPHGRWEGVQQGGAGDTPYSGLPSPEEFTVYPLTHLLSTGHVFASLAPQAGVVGSRRSSSSAFLNVNSFPPPVGAPSPWSLHASRLVDPTGQVVDLHYASAILWPITLTTNGPVGADRVVVFGGWDTNKPYDATNQTVPGSPAEDTVSEIQSPTHAMTPGSWTIPPTSGACNWGRTLRKRVYSNAVILPNLQLVLIGGSENEFKPYGEVHDPRRPGDEATAHPVYQPEYLDLLSPCSGWQLDEPQSSTRLYHSIALLLPDGRVLSAGGYRGYIPGNPLVNLAVSDVEIYSPVCLRTTLARPAIESASPMLAYGEYPSVKVSMQGFSGAAAANEIEFASLIRCGSVTHHFDWDQRCLKLEVVGVDDNEVMFAPIPDTALGRFVAPPGMYMLHIVRKKPAPPAIQIRVPSTARFVKVQ